MRSSGRRAAGSIRRLCSLAPMNDLTPSSRRRRLRDRERGSWSGPASTPAPSSSIADDADPVIRRTLVHRCGVRGALISERGIGFLERCTVRDNKGPGIEIARDGRAIFRRCRVHDNSGPGIHALKGAEGAVLDCDLSTGDGPASRFESARVLQSGNRE